MKFIFFLLLIVLFPFYFSAQSLCKQFHALSKPEKHWVFAHPFKAKKAFKITKEVEKAVDSIKQSGIIGVDNNGGKLDAFKHAYWMASISFCIGSKKAKKLGIAHEKGNYLQYKKHKLEESLLPDSVSSEMDLKNNETGISLIGNSKILSSQIIQQKVLIALKEGQLTIIKKDKEGNYLFCDGTKIFINEWGGKWGIPKCLVPSNAY